LLLDSGKNQKECLKTIEDFRSLRYLVIGEIDSDILSQLKLLGAEECPPPVRDREYKEKFLHEYIDIVGAIGAEQQKRLWWATDIASKNRFASKIPELLEQFLTVVEAAKNGGDLLFLDPPWQIIDSLVSHFEKKGVPCSVHGYRRARRRDMFFSRARRIASVFKTATVFLKKVNLARRVCRADLPAGKGPLYVIKSFIYDHSFSEGGNSYRDAFFGALPDFLKGKSRLLIFADILGDFRKGLGNISRCSSFSIIPMERMLSTTDVLATSCEALFSRFKIRGKYHLFEEYEVSSILRNEIARTFNGLAFYQLFHFRALKNLAGTADIGTFLLTYENNPWEKMCILALREYSPGTRIIGYQHTVVPQSSANMFISSNENRNAPKPDLILTVGEAPREIMERYGVFDQGLIRASCGLRFEYLFKLPMKERMRNGNIAIILEGIPDVFKMVDYVLGQLGNTKYQIRIRTHPVLPWDSIAPNLIEPWGKMSNVGFSSNKSIKEDIEWADVVIYWGTTVALEALSMGTPVIHFDTGSILSFDPLFECNNLKWKISRDGSLADLLKEIYTLDEKTFLAEQKNAKDYLNRYFHPITDEAMGKFLFNQQKAV
jgi:hypothetical protein